MAGPVAVSISYDGIVFVLEAGQRDGSDNSLIGPRVQAWDIFGNPSEMFFGGGKNFASAILPLDPTRAYVDICTIGSQKAGFLYIASGPLAADSDHTGYRVDVLPYGSAAGDNAAIITLPGVPAARIAVDDLHQLYVMEYAMTQDNNGSPAGPQVPQASGPLGCTVPRISKYVAYDAAQATSRTPGGMGS